MTWELFSTKKREKKLTNSLLPQNGMLKEAPVACLEKIMNFESPTQKRHSTKIVKKIKKKKGKKP